MSYFPVIHTFYSMCKICIILFLKRSSIVGLTMFAEFIVTFVAGLFFGALLYDQYGKGGEIAELRGRLEKVEAEKQE
jgi:hypothetical protein